MLSMVPQQLKDFIRFSFLTDEDNSFQSHHNISRNYKKHTSSFLSIKQQKNAPQPEKKTCIS